MGLCQREVQSRAETWLLSCRDPAGTGLYFGIGNMGIGIAAGCTFDFSFGLPCPRLFPKLPAGPLRANFAPSGAWAQFKACPSPAPRCQFVNLRLLTLSSLSTV